MNIGILTKLITILGVPFSILNAFGGIVAAIWLIAIGDWKTLIVGVVLVVFSSHSIAILMLPGAAFSVIAAAVGAKTNMRGMMFYSAAFINNLYIVVVITVWCIGVLMIFMALYSKAHASSISPYLLGSYGPALGVWQYLAVKEGSGPGLQGIGSITIVFFAQVAYVVVMLMGLFGGQHSFMEVTATFLTIMVVGCIIQTLITLDIQRKNYF